MYLRRNRLSRFLTGGMIDPDAYLINPTDEPKLDEAIEWQNGLKTGPERPECTTALATTEPTPTYHMVINPETGEEEEKETDAHAEWSTKHVFAQRHIKYSSINDIWDRTTDIGYMYSIHAKCGLDVVLRIPQISTEFNRDMFGTPSDVWYDYDLRTYLYLDNFFTIRMFSHRL